MDRLDTSTIIDLALIAAILVAALPGSWRGIVKESFISGSLLLAIAVTTYWWSEWTNRLLDWFDVSPSTAELIVRVAIPVLAIVFIGYVASVNAGIPPADVPGRVGGFVLGALNAIVFLAVVAPAIYEQFLDSQEQRYVDESRVARALVFDLDLIILGVAGVALIMTFASVSVRRRRMAILTPGGNRQGSSGYQIRREKPLAPEAEKIETGWPASTDPLSETVPIARVTDASGSYDRPANSASTWSTVTAEDIRAAQAEVVRCVSCGERLGLDDKFCPRCGRSLVR